MQNSLILLVPLLILCISVACLGWWLSIKKRRFERFAAAEGITYQWRGKTPIAVPTVVCNRSVTATKTYLYGNRHGVEVFACDFSVGQGRGNVEWLFMAAVHADLHDASVLDSKCWKMTALNGWTFLVPNNLEGGTLTIRKITTIWNALTAAVEGEDQKSVAATGLGDDKAGGN